MEEDIYYASDYSIIGLLTILLFVLIIYYVKINKKETKDPYMQIRKPIKDNWDEYNNDHPL